MPELYGAEQQIAPRVCNERALPECRISENDAIPLFRNSENDAKMTRQNIKNDAFLQAKRREMEITVSRDRLSTLVVSVGILEKRGPGQLPPGVGPPGSDPFALFVPCAGGRVA